MVYTEIISGLWIGNVDMMYKQQFIKDNQIEVIINCTYQYQFPEGMKQNIRFALPDNIHQCIDTLRANKDRIIQLIDTLVESHNILIVCYDGKNVSPFLVSMYLMNQACLTKEQVKQVIRSKNNEIPMDYDLNLLDL